MRLITLLAVSIVAVAAVPQSPPLSSRIIGGSLTHIDRWPEKANVMLFAGGNAFNQHCGGTILNNRSVLSAAHCARGRDYTYPANWFRLRLGSTWANSGGVVHNIALLTTHPNYNVLTLDSDVMIMRSATNFVYTHVLRQGTIASANYILGDNQPVWITGWGAWEGGLRSIQLREAQVFTINQNICTQLHSGSIITPNMLCTGLLNVGGRDSCYGDTGGPVFHNRIVVGIVSFGAGCGHPVLPRVNVRVTRFTQWIVNNA